MILLLLIVVAMVVGAFLWKPEPEFQGKSVTDWTFAYIEALNGGDNAGVNEAAAAMRAIGPRGIPTILDKIKQMPEPRRRARDFFKKVPGVGESLADVMRRLEKTSDAAGYYFSVLGTKARHAIPELAQIAQETDDAQICFRAVDCLIEIGPDAWPTLSNFLSEPSSLACRMILICGVYDVGFDWVQSVPVFVQKLSVIATNQDPMLRKLAVECVGRLAVIEPEGLNLLTKAFEDADEEVRAATLRPLTKYRRYSLVRAALNDPDPYVKGLAQEILSTVEVTPRERQTVP